MPATKRIELTVPQIKWNIEIIKADIKQLTEDIKKTSSNTIWYSILKLNIENKKDLLKSFESKLK